MHRLGECNLIGRKLTSFAHPLPKAASVAKRRRRISFKKAHIVLVDKCVLFSAKE